MINKVTLVGNLGRDPELRRLESGAAVAQFSIATSENYKDRNGEWQTSTEWHDIVLWRNLAERAESQLKKGMLIYLEGKLSTRKWEDKDGNPRKTTEVVGSYLRIINRREEQSNGGYTPAAQASPAQPSAPASNAEGTQDASPAAKPDAGKDDLPF